MSEKACFSRLVIGIGRAFVARMARLNQLFEYLFVNAGSALVLDSGTTGVFQQDGASPFPVFRAPLSSGQILLLFADVVPRELSTKLLSGVPVEFQHETNFGVVNVHMTLNSDDLRVTAHAVRRAAPTLVPISGGSTIVPGPMLGPPPPDLGTPMSFSAILHEMVARRASHLHVSNSGAVLVRVDGQLVQVQDLRFTERQLLDGLRAIAPAGLGEAIASHPRFDFSYVTDTEVFHLSLQQGRGGLSLVVRHLPRQVPNVSSLGLPSELVQAMTGGGLWVLAAPPGHGATTSLASVIQTVVTQRSVSVRCLESPIEYVLTPGAGPLTQVEVGVHVTSFEEGLRDALHDDVDVVMVSELDDAEVLHEALTLAERGKLVVGSLHARCASQAAEKLVHLTERIPTARWQLGQTLRGVFAQALCRNTEGARSLAWELLPGLPAVRSAIVDGHRAAFPSLRTRSLEQSLADLVASGVVEPAEALNVAPDRATLEALLARISESRSAA